MVCDIGITTSQENTHFPTPPDTDCVICYEKVDQVLLKRKLSRAGHGDGEDGREWMLLMFRNWMKI